MANRLDITTWLYSDPFLLISLISNKFKCHMRIHCCFICGQKYELCAAKNKLYATIFVLCTDNFNYLRPFYFIYMRRNVPEAVVLLLFLIVKMNYWCPLKFKKEIRRGAKDLLFNQIFLLNIFSWINFSFFCFVF